MSIVTFTLKSATTNAAAPFSIGHAFRRGDVPAGSQLVSGLSDMQVVAKNAWPDGSLKFAVISGLAPLVANTPLLVVLSIGTPAAGTALTTADLKATGITASITTDAIGGGFAYGFATWATTDWDAPFQTWISGPKMSSWIYRKPIGTDPHLVAWLEVRLWSGGEVEVLPWVENGYLKVAGATNKNALYSFFLGSHVFGANIDLKHHQRTVLIDSAALSYWWGTPFVVAPAHDKAYLQATELVPTYRAQVPSNSSLITGLASSYTPLAAGNIIYDGDYMLSTGYQTPIGLLPQHDMLYLVANADNIYGSVLRNGFSAGRWGIHYRDENTNRPLRFSQHATLAVGSGQGFWDYGGSTVSNWTATGTGGSPPLWDIAHSPAVGYMAYLLTGHWYFMEEVQFATVTNYLVHGNATALRDGSKGLVTPLAGAYGTRNGAWEWRSRIQALTVTPDTDTALRTEFINSIESNIDYFHATYIAQTNNPYGWVRPGEWYTDAQHGAPWQQDFFTAVFGWAVSMGLPISSTSTTKLAAFFQWKAKSVVRRLGVQGDFWYIYAAPYNMIISPATTPNYDTGAGPWLADDAAVYAATYATPPTWLTNVPNVLAADGMPGADSMWGNLQPAIAYAVRHGVPGAQAGYDRMVGASNWGALDTQFDSKPVWSVMPVAASAPLPAAVGIDHVTRVDTTDYISGVTVCGDGGFGVLASEIPTGFANPSLLANDVDGADPANTVYRTQILTGPSAGTLVVYEDGSAVCTPPSSGYVGVITGTQRIWKNNEVAYDTTYSFTFGTTGVTRNLTGANLSQSATVSTGAITVTRTVNLTGSNLNQAATVSSGAVTITPPAPPPAAPRYARPMADIRAGAWLPSSGSKLYAMTYAPSVNNTDFIYTTTPNVPAEVRLNPVQDPGTNTGQVVRYQAWSMSGTGIIVRLKQGSTVIAEWPHAALPTSPTVHVQILSTLECDSITDYTDLRFEFVAV